MTRPDILTRRLGQSCSLFSFSGTPPGRNVRRLPDPSLGVFMRAFRQHFSICADKDKETKTIACPMGRDL